MQSFQRAFALFLIVIAAGFLAGCGGPGAPVSGGSDPASEAAAAALAPEGGPDEAAAEPATEAATESAPKSQAGDASASAPEN
ncbi:MAG: hypothetical protein O3C40_21375 [Planctomycetota bacterium]|nr:hypothetical protein [Planctomycetota bacterium]